MNVLISRTGLAVRAVVAGIHSRTNAILETSESGAVCQYQPCHPYHSTAAAAAAAASLNNTASTDAAGNTTFPKHKNLNEYGNRNNSSSQNSGGGGADSSSSAPPTGPAGDGFSPFDQAAASTSSSDGPNSHKCSPHCKRQFMTVRCGFAKDMLFRNSCVADLDCYGDDACFVARSRLADVVGVADGVGGWRLHGIDPSVFARKLMSRCEQLVEEGQFEPTKPAQLLASAYSHMKYIRLTQRTSQREREEDRFIQRGGEKKSAGNVENEDLVIGSSTACVVVLDKASSKLYAANLGDSGFIVVREGRVIHRSEEQCHYFNAPYQLTLPPPSRETDRSFLSDSPDSAQTCSLDVCDGDLVLVATDGLYDNMPTDLIESQLKHLDASCSEDQLQAACNSIALQARRLSLDERFLSPFAKKARENGLHAIGGKPDDITIVLVAVTRQHNSSDSE